MRLLLDTHVLLWWLADSTELRDGARTAISNPETQVYVSAASAWEIGIKRSTGKLRAPPDLEARIEAHRFEPLAITVAHALEAADLPPHHADPFDRMLVAQARAEKLTLVSSDRRLAAYEVDVLAA